MDAAAPAGTGPGCFAGAAAGAVALDGVAAADFGASAAGDGPEAASEPKAAAMASNSLFIAGFVTPDTETLKVESNEPSGFCPPGFGASERLTGAAAAPAKPTDGATALGTAGTPAVCTGCGATETGWLACG
mmetsp:Transcript_56128/g.133718  ORF Transcript_56128/g.133718 Transcript_56128/m.133718 type:complete len:132 (+) Transcript_56128:498-893(+)